MCRTTGHARATSQRGFSINDLLWWILALALVIAILLPSLSRARELSKWSVCAANQRSLGQGMHIYANDNMEWFPHHYYEPKYNIDTKPPEHGVLWVGTMGSNDFLKISEKQEKKSPSKNHPSRSLFLLVIQGASTPKMQFCPSSGDVDDDLRNCGPDSDWGKKDSPAIPGVTRFDFQGYKHLSYGYQLPYGPKAKPRENLDVRMALLADKGPYYEEAGEGLAGTKTSRDKRSNINPPADWAKQPADDIVKLENDKWRPYNSRNHNGEGQNVLFVDGHVEFVKKPIVGVHNDNIYTIKSAFEWQAAIIGLVPAPDKAQGPLTETDSFIVP